jgi:hypothetical protein
MRSHAFDGRRDKMTCQGPSSSTASVGLQMLMVSRPATAAKSVVALSRPPATSAEKIGGQDVRGCADSACDRLDFSRIDVDAGRFETGASQFNRERKTDVAEADDAGAGRAGTNLIH